MNLKFKLFLSAMLMMMHSTFAQDSTEIRIMNRDTTIRVGDTLLIDAVYYNAKDSIENQEIYLSVEPDSLGTFVGKSFIATKTGSGTIRASFAYTKD